LGNSEIRGRHYFQYFRLSKFFSDWGKGELEGGVGMKESRNKGPKNVGLFGHPSSTCSRKRTEKQLAEGGHP
jgi:hypothetical protein